MTARVRPADAPMVSVILGTYNRRAALERFLAAVPEATGGLSHEIVIADGGSTDGSRELIAATPHTVLVEGGREGAVKAYNAAFAVTRGWYTALLNDDCFPRPLSLWDAIVELQRTDAGQAALAMTHPNNRVPYVNQLFPRTSDVLYANFAVMPWALASWIAEIQGGIWWTGYHTYAGDCELSAWVHKLGHRVIPVMEGIIDDEPVHDEMRRTNMHSTNRKPGSYAFVMRWGKGRALDPAVLDSFDATTQEAYRRVEPFARRGAPAITESLAAIPRVL